MGMHMKGFGTADCVLVLDVSASYSLWSARQSCLVRKIGAKSHRFVSDDDLTCDAVGVRYAYSVEKLAASRMLFFGSSQRRLHALALLVVIFIAHLIPSALAQTYKCQFPSA